MVLSTISDALGRLVDATPAWALTLALLLLGLVLVHIALRWGTAAKRKAVKAVA